jgi:hypothetical protein
VLPTLQLNTQPVGSSFFPAALDRGVTLLEPFGGLGAGLEMALRSGLPVKRYLYCDSRDSARAIAAHRAHNLAALFPALLPPQALEGAFSLPQDVRLIKTEHLVSAGAAQQDSQWLVVGGWPCQDFSNAGKRRGLQGERASLLSELTRLVGTLQQLQPKLPPAYIIENVAFQLSCRPHLAADFEQVCGVLHAPVVLDAAAFGSLAHRVRNWWTNLCAPRLLVAAAQQVKRPAGRGVHLALGPGRHAQPVKNADQPPRWPCDAPGRPRQAWPTLMAHPFSYAFRPGEPGSVWDDQQQRWDQPSAEEREVALGYEPGSTAAPGASERDRCSALGECMDANCLQGLMAIARAWWRRDAPQPAGASALQPQVSQAGSGGGAAQLALAAAAAELEESPLAPDAAGTDIWLDANALSALQQGEIGRAHV